MWTQKLRVMKEIFVFSVKMIIRYFESKEYNNEYR